MEYSVWDKSDEERVATMDRNKKETMINRHNKSLKYELYKKLGLLLLLGAVHQILYVKLKLKLIALAKELFILNINLGIKIYVPREININ
jgi:hypothetical protein